MSRFVDLSLTVEMNDSEDIPVEIEYFDHADGARHMADIFGVAAVDLPDQAGWAGERVRMITHAGTHMDAPWHYGRTSAGLPARTIDQIALDDCVGNGLILDFRELADGAIITLAAVRQQLAGRQLTVQAGDIVLFCSGRDQFWGASDYKERGPGVAAEVVEYLAGCGVRVMGIDAWGFDRPFSYMRRDYARSGDVAVIWPAHYMGKRYPYCQLEKLCHLDQLLGRKARIYCPPIKISGAGAGWCRVFAELLD